MLRLVVLVFGVLLHVLGSRRDLVPGNITLRQQLVVIRHVRREIAHFNVTEHPTAAWVGQQVREAFPFDTAPKYFVFDRDSIFSTDAVRAVRNLGTKPTRTSYRSP